MTCSVLFASLLNLSVMLGNYLQQTTSADVFFSDAFFLGTLRVKFNGLLAILTFIWFTTIIGHVMPPYLT